MDSTGNGDSRGDCVTVRVRRFTGSGTDCEAFEDTTDTIVSETALTVVHGDFRFTLSSCSPSCLEYLAVGHLASLGRIGKDDRITCLERPEEGNVIRVQTGRELESTGGAGKAGRLPASQAVRFPPEAICGVLDDLLRRSPLFQMTGGVHAAALCDAGGILVWHDDIGRHNAVDKVVGHALLDGITQSDKFLALTGRINSEIAAKVASAGIPVVATKAPPTSLGVAVAGQAGVTVVGFVRNLRLTVYTCPERIVGRGRAVSFVGGMLQ